MRQSEWAVLNAVKAAADERGRASLDKHALARATGYSASICCNARTRLVQLGLLRKIGFSRPTLLQVVEVPDGQT